MRFNKFWVATVAMLSSLPAMAHSGHGPDDSVMAHIGDSFQHLSMWLAIGAVIAIAIYVKSKR